MLSLDTSLCYFYINLKQTLSFCRCFKYIRIYMKVKMIICDMFVRKTCQFNNAEAYGTTYKRDIGFISAGRPAF